MPRIKLKKALIYSIENKSAFPGSLLRLEVFMVFSLKKAIKTPIKGLLWQFAK
jgi:hypothetical protein